MRRLLTWLVLVSPAVLTLVGFWWWALFGLSEEVGTAIGVTVAVALCAVYLMVESAP